MVYYRFWPSGRFLLRQKMVRGTDRPSVDRTDGDVVDEHLLLGDGLPPSVVGAYVVSDGRLYLEQLLHTPDGLRFHLSRATILEEGFVVTHMKERQPAPLASKEWVPLSSPPRYQRVHVGPMVGEPTW